MKFLKTVLAVAVAFIFVGCGEETTRINQLGVDSYASADDLPECKKDNQGELAWIKGETSVRICSDGKWFATLVADSTKDIEYSCSSEELADSSGIKIICNGDSIGVVLNGIDGTDGKDGEKGDKGDAGNKGEKGDAGDQGVSGIDGIDGDDGSDGSDGSDGKDGKDGKDGVGCKVSGQTDTTVSITCGESEFVMDLGYATKSNVQELDSEKVVTILESLEGVSQKGPFLKGSTVNLYELSDGRTLKQTNGNFMSYITQDDGRYKFSARNLVSQYAMIIVNGSYRNEVTGNNSNKQIRLRAITDMTERSSVNVNLLTNLEFDRVYYLVTREKKKVRNAKKQAQAEIFNAFHIDTTGFKGSAEDFDVFGATNADAALLAISIMMQGDSNETYLTVLLTEFANDLEKDGMWDDSTAKSQIADWSAMADAANRLGVFRENVMKWGLTQSEIPEFEKFIRKYWSIENGLGVCGDEENPVGFVRHVNNPRSRFFARSYTDTDTIGGNARFICADADSAKWRPAKKIEMDTLKWGKGNEGDIRSGQVNTNLTYVFQEGYWRYGTEMDAILKQACMENGQVSDTIYNNYYYKCEELAGDTIRGWKKTDDVLNDTYEYQYGCKDDGVFTHGELLPGRVRQNTLYVCDNGEFRVANAKEIFLNIGCTSYNKGDFLQAGESDLAKYGYMCEDESTINPYLTIIRDESKFGVLVDSRDGKEYRTIEIGGHVWMAENLNFDYKVNGSTYGSLCNMDQCEKFGRYYSWAAAMDSAAVYHIAGRGCGYITRCYPASRVRGVCPEGWHLPSTDEFYSIDLEGIRSIGFEAWGNATDAYGFSALPAGYYHQEFRGFGSVAYFWTSGQESDIYSSYRLYLSSSLALVSTAARSYSFSVRCVQDY